MTRRRAHWPWGCRPRFAIVISVLLAVAGAAAAQGAGTPVDAPGADLASLLAYAREHNPDFASLRYDAEAAAERAEPAGALPDPRLRTEFRDITRMGEQNATLAPSRVGSTRYLVMQDVPWFGKRDLRREVAELEAASAQGRALASWADIAARIKTAYAQRYYLSRSGELNRETLDLMTRLEQIVRTRYANGLAAQQDVIRAQVEQTTLRNELIGIDAEQHHMVARMNALLARPPHAPLAEPAALPPLPSPARLDPAQLEARIAARNPSVAVEDRRVEAAEKSRDLAYRNRYPDFTVGVSPIQYGSAVKEWEVMVELNIPLQQASRRAQEREAEAMLASARARQSAASQQALADLAENLVALDASRRTATLLADSLLPQAELTFRAALAGYENGRVDFATLLDAQRQIRQARLSRIKAEAEAQSRLAEVERLLGDTL